jgi:ABC-type xylose transport system permease subunit
VFFFAVQLMAMLGGLINSAQLSSGSFTYGREWGTDVISAVVIGGTPMGGGVGTVFGTLIGILFVGVLTNGMTILAFQVYSQFLVRGIVLFGAVFFSAIKLSYSRKT